MANLSTQEQIEANEKRMDEIRNRQKEIVELRSARFEVIGYGTDGNNTDPHLLELNREDEQLDSERKQLSRKTFYLRNPQRTPEMDEGSDYSVEGKGLRRSYKKEEERRQKQQAEYQAKIDAGYEQVTTTEWEEEWDGEGGQWVTRTEWVKTTPEPTDEPTDEIVYRRNGIHLTHEAVVRDGKVVRVNAVNQDGKVVQLNTTKLGYLIGMTAAEIEALHFKAVDNEPETITYQRIHTPEPYCIDRAEVVDGKVVRAYVHALKAELVGDWDLPQFIGLTIVEIEAQGFKAGHNPDVIKMANEYHSGSDYKGLGNIGHGNRNVPTRAFLAHRPRK